MRVCPVPITIFFCIMMTWTRCVQTPPTYTVSRYAISDLLDLNKKVKEWITFLKRAPNFSLRERKCYETKVAKEYCWATTQTAAEQVPVCGILLSADSLVCTHRCMVDHTYACAQFRRPKFDLHWSFRIVTIPLGVSVFSFLDVFF